MLLAHGLAEHGHRLDVAPFPADVGDGDDLHPRLGIGVRDQRPALSEGDDGRRGVLGVGEIAVGDAAGDLEIDDALVHLVPRDHLAMQRAERVVAERRVDCDLGQRAVEPGEMGVEIEQLPVEHRRHLVDPIAE